MNDVDILELIRSDVQRGMSVLIDKYNPLIYTIVKNKISFFCSIEDIEEVVSDVFVTVYDKRESIKLMDDSIAPYIARIAKNKAIDKIRARGKILEVSVDEESYIEIPDSYNLQSNAERNALYKRLIAEINALGEPDSTIIYRKYYLGESSSVIANAVGLTRDNVRQRLSRSLRKIEEKLKGDYYEDFIK